MHSSVDVGKKVNTVDVFDLLISAYSILTVG